MKSLSITLTLLAGILSAPPALAGEHVVTQKARAFSQSRLVVKIGEPVVFRNDDPFFHNIFSLTDAQPFDLGSFGNGETRKVVFGKEGTYEVECAIHPQMKLTIEVRK